MDITTRSHYRITVEFSDGSAAVRRTKIGYKSALECARSETVKEFNQALMAMRKEKRDALNQSFEFVMASVSANFKPTNEDGGAIFFILQGAVTATVRMQRLVDVD